MAHDPSNSQVSGQVKLDKAGHFVALQPPYPTDDPRSDRATGNWHPATRARLPFRSRLIALAPEMPPGARPSVAARRRMPPPRLAYCCYQGVPALPDGAQPVSHRACGQRCAQRRRGRWPALGITGDHLCITKGDVPADVRKPLRVSTRPCGDPHREAKTQPVNSVSSSPKMTSSAHCPATHDDPLITPSRVNSRRSAAAIIAWLSVRVSSCSRCRPRIANP